MKTFLVLTILSSLFLTVYTATTCIECGDDTCILDSTTTSITGGATFVIVNFCNYDSTQSNNYVLHLSVSSIPSCDVNNATLPVVASLVAAEGCTPDAVCAVTVNFESALDWAIALQNNEAPNALTAQLMSSDNTDVATIATFQPTAAAIMNSGMANVSVCATEVNVTALKLSRVDRCNMARICRGPSTDTTCTMELINSAQVQNVRCNGEKCLGRLTWSQPLPCDGSVGDSTALTVGVTVANSTQSNFVSVGSMTAPAYNISDVRGFNTGSSEMVLMTDTFCSYSGISLNMSYADQSNDESSEQTIEVSSVSSATNGTVVVELTSPLSSELVGGNIQLSLSQCGVLVTGLFSNENGFIVSDLTSAEVDEGITNSTGTTSTQVAQSPTGLSNDVAVGIAIAVVALAGFIFECINHKRKQPKAPAQGSPVITPL